MKDHTCRKPIKEWAEEDRPREKMMEHGKHVLSDKELLAVLISSGNKDKSAMDLSEELLELCEWDLNVLAKMEVRDLLKQPGIGIAKAVTIAAAIEFGGRRQTTEVRKKKKIVSSKEVFDSLRFRLGDLNHEEFWLVSLNRANHILHKRMISEGGLSGTIADPKKIFKYALEDRAVSIIVCHNHPSGNLTPSTADKQLTQKIKQAGLLLEIPLLDHIIITSSGYFSFADQGIL